MSSECWFVLKQQHYPPPVFPENGTGKSEGLLCLGHIIPDLEHIDNVINAKDGPLTITPDMPIHKTEAYNLTWERDTARGLDCSLDAGAPIAGAAGITAKIETGVVFKRSVKDFWVFDTLETYIIQPTGEYIEDSVEAPQIATYLKKRRVFKSPSVFMITGLKIARGASSQTSSGNETGAHFRPAVQFPSIAEAGIGLGAGRSISSSQSASQWTDFVWAIRLAKVSQGLLDRSWSHATVFKGATLGLEETPNDAEGRAAGVVEELAREGLEIGSQKNPSWASSMACDTYDMAGAILVTHLTQNRPIRSKTLSEHREGACARAQKWNMPGNIKKLRSH
ncbi:uncharacterized protein PG998_011763 [Apiospora kogelbergensis]|uniref:uncharacterized protein n=1 Tax=Apiospora kogelbergensis TaxID=1337665 RepID=UPI00312D864D